MTDKGLVISTEKGIAQVEVSCFEGCQNCTVRSLCIGNKQNMGRLSVKNPLQAKPGDEVKVEIPETRYSQALSQLFGGLLAAVLIGLGGGYLIALFCFIPLFLTCLIGVTAGLAFGALILSIVFRRKNENQLYPVIIDILKKGEQNG